jgi:hypothetical protein
VKAIKSVSEHPALNALVNKCHARAQSAFRNLCECVPKGKDHATFERYVKPIRNTIAFHYDSREVAWALNDRVYRASASKICSATTGEDVHSTRFEFADALLDTIVCRKLWGILDADARGEADRISDWCFHKSLEFLDFGENFVHLFLSQHALQ